MEKDRFLGIDIGTFETKGVICDAQGRILATSSRPHKMHVPKPGWAEHRPEEDWWRGIVDTASTLFSKCDVKPSEIAAIATSAIGPCMLPVDRAGHPLMNAVLYGVDTRSAEEIQELTSLIGEKSILEFNGNALTSQAVGPKILWLKRNRPEVFEQAASIVSSTTFLVQKLTGNCVIDHYTAANFVPLYNSNTQKWDDSLCGELIEIDRLPQILWTCDIAGAVTAEAALETGLAEGTPVTVGTIDAAAEAASVGVIAPGDLMVMYGSTMFFVTVTSERICDARLWYAPWLFPTEHSSLAGLSTSGTLTHWFRETFASELERGAAFATLVEEAASSPPGAKGLIMLPYFSGERTPIHDPNAKGCIFGLDLTHTRGDIFRAMLEGIAYGTRHVFETFAETGAKPGRLQAVGGGTKNNIWLQATSDISELDQTVREITLGASYGDAFLAAVAIGAVERDRIKEWNKVSRTVRAAPNQVYEAGYEAFRELYERTRDLMRRL